MSKEELLNKLAALIEQEWKDAIVEVTTEDDEPAVAIEFASGDIWFVEVSEG